MVVVGVTVILQPSTGKARKCLCVALCAEKDEGSTTLRMMTPDEVEGCDAMSETLHMVKEHIHAGLVHFRAPSCGRPLWAPIDLFLQKKSVFFTLPIAETTLEAVRREDITTVERAFKCWRPRVFYHGTTASEAAKIGGDRGVERRGPYMLGYGFCAAFTAWAAARYAHWHKEPGRSEWLPRSSGGAIIMVLVFSDDLRDQSKNTIYCQSDIIKAQLVSESPVTRWRGEKSRLFVDHTGLWERQGYDGIYLLPTCLGVCPIDAKEHWLVRNGEAIFKPNVVVPMYVASLDHKRMPDSWDPAGDRDCIV